MITYINAGTSALSKEFWTEIDRHIAEGNRILMHDPASNDVGVYCLDHGYKNVSSLDTSVMMIEECDTMTAVWDGENRPVFCEIMLAIVSRKPCRLFIAPLQKWLDVNTLDDIEMFVSRRPGRSKDDIGKILKACGFDDEMITCNLNNSELSEKQICRIICGAPVSISIKEEMFRSLRSKDNYCYELFNKTAELISRDTPVRAAIKDIVQFHSTPYICKCTSIIRSAVAHLGYSVFCVFSESYDADACVRISRHEGVFDSFDKVMDYINSHDSDWFKVEEWDIHTPPCDRSRFNYYIYGGEICWFEEMLVYEPDNARRYCVPGNIDFADISVNCCLSMMNPFKAGDIVNIDCTPFGPPFHALILCERNLFGKGQAFIVFKCRETGRWSFSVLRQYGLYKNHTPVLSPYYRLRTVRDDEYSGDDEFLFQMSNALKTDAKIGRTIWLNRNLISHDPDKTAGEIRELWETVNMEKDQ